MRVLFTCVVGSGHFNPMVPLARAFLASGHAVAFATDPGFGDHVRRVGFEAFPAGLDMPVAMARFYRTQPNWRDVAPQDQVQYLVPGLFGGVRVDPMLEDLGRIIPDWRPDLLIHDSVELAGGIAAELAGIAHVEHSFGVLRPLEIRRLAVDALAPVADRLGVPNPGVGGLGGELYLDICPPGIQRPEIADLPRVQQLRPVGFDDAPDAVLPTWLDPLPSRPLVYVTMGTEFNKKPEIFRSILDGLAGEPFEVVVTVGASGDPAALGPRRQRPGRTVRAPVTAPPPLRGLRVARRLGRAARRRQRGRADAGDPPGRRPVPERRDDRRARARAAADAGRAEPGGGAGCRPGACR